MQENIYCLYRHIRPDKGEVFYIGIGGSERPYEKDGRGLYWNNIVRLNPNYEIEIMFENLTWEEACNKEREFIKLYGRKDLGLGTLVNLTDGGEGVPGYRFTKEVRKKISDALTGEKNGMYGKSRPEELKLKYSKLYKGKKKTPEEVAKRTGEGNQWFGVTGADNPKSKPIQIINTITGEIIIKPSRVEAANHLGMDKSHINRCIRTNKLYNRTYTFKYVN